MSTTATRRAVSDVLAHGLRGDLAGSIVGVELGQQLASAITCDGSDGATSQGIREALRSACDQEPVAYARVLELIVLAGVNEQQLIAGLPTDPQREAPDVPAAPPRRSARRRRAPGSASPGS